MIISCTMFLLEFYGSLEQFTLSRCQSGLVPVLLWPMRSICIWPTSLQVNWNTSTAAVPKAALPCAQGRMRAGRHRLEVMGVHKRDSQFCCFHTVHAVLTWWLLAVETWKKVQ